MSALWLKGRPFISSLSSNRTFLARARAKCGCERYASISRIARARRYTESRMARMFGFIGNRPDLGARVLEANASLLRARRTVGDPLGWGLGFYPSGGGRLRG